MIWKTIPSYPQYEASDTGLIRRAVGGQGARAGHVLAPSRDRYGYFKVMMPTTGAQVSVRVSRLVCEAFHGQPTAERNCCAHNDGDPANNIPSNLRWASHAENMADKNAHGTALNGEANPSARLTPKQVLEMRSEYQGKRGQTRALGRKYGISAANASCILSGKYWTDRKHFPENWGAWA